MTLTRRSFVAGALGSLTVFARSSRAADFTLRQFHNQPETSSLHRRLVDMWTAVRDETQGRVDVQVFAENNKTPGSDPAVLKMLMSGEVPFFTVMGGILGTEVPAAEAQQMPFWFPSSARAHRAMDGWLGAYLAEEMAAKGIFSFPVGAFDNGMRQIAGTKRPIAQPEDLTGIRMRVPAGALLADTFKALGADTVTVNSDGIYDALKTGRVDAQENPLALVQLFKLDEVVKYVSMTNHMWSGFNLIAHLPTWRRLPRDITTIIARNATKHVRLQRNDQEQMNTAARATLAGRGLAFNEVDAAPFRAKLSGLYSVWKERLGTRCWSILQASARGRGQR
jgi:tripartite ATP-independent transporter DctP family solute receptor